MLKSDRLIAGRMTWLQPSCVTSEVDRPRNEPTSPRPPDGRTPSSTAKVMIRSMPIQKVGTEKPSTEKAMIALAPADCGR